MNILGYEHPPRSPAARLRPGMYIIKYVRYATHHQQQTSGQIKLERSRLQI